MHAIKVLHNYFGKACITMHKKRVNRLFILVESLLNQGKLSVTSLGQYTLGNAQVKNKIKAADRFLGNKNFHSERFELYQGIASHCLRCSKRADIVVDWSSCANRENHVLRASVVYRHRCITIYEEVHREEQLGKYKVHQRFLSCLKEIVPSSCQVTIVTDAGFRTEWFELVKELGWDYVGRILSNMVYQKDAMEWQACTLLYAKASHKPQYVGRVKLSKVRKLDCYLYLYQAQQSKGLKKKEKRKQAKVSYRTRATTANQYRRVHRLPWLLATSLEGYSNTAKKIVKGYRRRMKIEHDFRDTKDIKCGLGLNLSRTRNAQRLATLLLLGALASLLLMLIGLAAEHKNLHYQFQVNSVKNKRVLSLLFLGMQVIRHSLHLINYYDLTSAMKNLLQNEVHFYP